MSAADAMSRLGPGFDDIGLDSQAMFRVCLSAMANPGRIHPLSVSSPRTVPAGLNRSAAALLLALLDQDTAVWLPPAARQGDCGAYLRFHTGCSLSAASATATFALIDDDCPLPPLAAFAQGSEAYPDRSTTVVVQCRALRERQGWTLRGPGIESHCTLDVEGVVADFPERWAANRAVFPRGVDLFLAAPDAIAALPRTVRVEA
jgi:alpha-D-ribose 1-methylphosphonate 5-triphosphate synthase subunit PhnH